MKRKSSTRGGRGVEDEKWDAGTNKKRSSSGSSSNDKRKENTTNLLPPPPPPVIGTVATRTRRQQRELATKWKHPISNLIHIMGYADPDTIRKLCCVSKQLYDLIAHDSGMEQNRAIPLLEISPAEDKDNEGRLGRLLRLLDCHRDKLQRYIEIKFIDVHKFGIPPQSERMELDKITDTLRLYGIISLDMSSPRPSTDTWNNYIYRYIPTMLPNLRDVNLSNTGFYSLVLYNFFTKCPNLEKLTWHNIDRNQSAIDIDGLNMKDATNLKELYMDDSDFAVVNYVNERHQFSDLENKEHSDIFLFHKLSSRSKLLERVSIRNAKWYDYYRIHEDATVIPQTALIKFVRKAPLSLRWFRSDLTEENMTMLRSERPGIELVN